MDHGGELERLQSENEYLQDRLNDVYASTSWRATIALRAVERLIRRRKVLGSLWWRSTKAHHGPRVPVVHRVTLPTSHSGLGAGDASVCAIVHGFYPEVLPEFVERLLLCTRLSHVIVTHPPHVGSVQALEAFAPLVDRGVAVVSQSVENRGRDLFALVAVAQRALDTDCDAFIKVHTKKSADLPNGAGESWRQGLLAGLLPSSEAVEKQVAFIVNAPVAGFAAPRRWIDAVERDIMNRSVVRRLARRGGLRGRRRSQMLYPTGTMYWCGRNWLTFVRDLGLRPDEFDPEPLRHIANFAHGMERLIGCFVADRRASVWLTSFDADR